MYAPRARASRARPAGEKPAPGQAASGKAKHFFAARPQKERVAKGPDGFDAEHAAAQVRAARAEIKKSETEKPAAAPNMETGKVQILIVTEDEEGMRIDRWFKRRFPTLSLSHLAKICRKGEVRVLHAWVLQVGRGSL